MPKITIELDENEYLALKKLAKKDYSSTTRIVRLAIRGILEGNSFGKIPAITLEKQGIDELKMYIRDESKIKYNKDGTEKD